MMEVSERELGRLLWMVGRGERSDAVWNLRAYGLTEDEAEAWVVGVEGIAYAARRSVMAR